MSNTSAALENRRIAMRNGHADKARHWALAACEHLPQDITLPEHIRVFVHVEIQTWIDCRRCHKVRPVESVAEAADFRDRHYHCGEKRCEVWRCPTCDSWEFSFLDRCRFCDTERTDACASGSIHVTKVLDQYALYDVYLGKAWRASIRCNSLLRAKRAARAMYPREQAKVASVFGAWDSGA